MNMDAAKRASDARLRHRILRLLQETRSTPFVRGRFVLDTLNGVNGRDHFEDDEHAVSLLLDLNDEGYIDLQDKRTHRDEPYGLDYLDVRIKARGTRFLEGGEAPDPLIDDGRIVK